jgi:cell division protein FtsZ
MAGEEIKVVGVGGSGCAACERMRNMPKCDFIGINTDAPSLLKGNIPLKVLIGLEVTKGRSTGNNISLGEEAAVSDRGKIESILEGSKLTFLISGIGGGTGAGAAPVVAEAAKSQGSLVVAFVNMPFTSEGKICMSNAKTGLDNLSPYCDLIVVLENDRFLQALQNAQIEEAFKKVNEILFDAVSAMAKISLESGLDSMKNLLSGFGSLGYGVGEDPLRATSNATQSKLLLYELKESKGAMMHIRGPHAEEGFGEALNFASSNIGPEKPIIWSHEKKQGSELFDCILLVTGFPEKPKLP